MRDVRLNAAPLVVATVMTALGCTSPPDIAPRTDYREVAESLSAYVEHEMTENELPALSIALVDDQETVWARGFGYADPVDSVRATAATVYRVGSVSKLFTDLGVMQLVERGDLDLDAPITDYLPDFQPENPFETPITLRQLMSHRSGLVREPPAGHYFDSTGTSLESTVRSLDGTTLVYAPQTRSKYSNAGIAVVGYVLEQLHGEPFATYLARSVLGPLGMNSSSFVPQPEIVKRLARAYMWSYHGQPFDAPGFELGMAPAGSMYAPVTDVAKLLSALFAGGMGENGRVVSEAALNEMLTPQFAPPDATTGFGLGFALGRLDGQRVIRHGGAIYGFATEFAGLPDVKLGAIAVTTMDGANAVVSRVVRYGLRLMRAAREDRALPPVPRTDPVPAALARSATGRFERGDQVIEIVSRPHGTYASLRVPGIRMRLRARGDDLVASGRLSSDIRFVPIDGALIVNTDTFPKVSVQKPRPAPREWRGLIGEYGWDYDVLYILEKDGALHALIEWFFEYPLERISRDEYAFPPWGLYEGERLRFMRDASGRATRVDAAGIVFERRAVGTEDGSTFTITPTTPAEELRQVATTAAPPTEQGDFREPNLVELRSLDPTLEYDIRYATTNNFMGTVFYEEAAAFMQEPAAQGLVRAHGRLARQGYGLLIHDAYRPWYVTKMFWDATPPAQKIFVANPSQGSRHNRGAAVDLTMFDRSTGNVVEMVGGYDEFSDRSFPEYPGGTSLQRWHRELLRGAMEAEDFRVYRYEWWHFDFRDWRRYPIMNQTFDAMLTGAGSRER